MPKFGTKSKSALHSCDDRLIKIFNEVIKTVDCSVLEGHRNQVDQDKAYEDGKSKVKYPHGNHNKLPSRACDVVPYPLDWNDRERFFMLAGFVLSVANKMRIKIRWGGNWRGLNKGKIDFSYNRRSDVLDDLPHFELLCAKDEQSK